VFVLVAKVIHKILLEMRAWFLDKQRQDAAWRARTLVLDYQGRPEVLFSPPPAAPTPAGAAVPAPAAQHAAAASAGAALDARLPPPESAVWRGRGECDIKAFFWMQ
jgi:hypothetical protein